MTMWFGIVLGAMAFAGVAFVGSSADYVALLGYFPPPDPNGIEPAPPNHISQTFSSDLEDSNFDEGDPESKC